MADEKKTEEKKEAKKEPKDKEALKKKYADLNKKKASGKGKKGLGQGTQVQVAAPGETRITGAMEPRLAKQYREEVVPALKKELNLENIHEIPRLEKIVINCGVKDAVGNPKVLDNTLADIAQITGQKPVLTRAKKAIAGFKLRKGIPIGVRVTLRRARMYEFFDRLVNVAIPRVRDFKGVPTRAFDGRGNYSMGLREQVIFPEISYDSVDKSRGMTVTIATSSKNNQHARALLTKLGMPFRK